MNLIKVSDEFFGGMSNQELVVHLALCCCCIDVRDEGVRRDEM